MDEPEPAVSPDPERTSEFALVDLTDAFCHFAVTRDELQHCISPDVCEGQALVWVAMLFGFNAAPLLMGRLSAALGRLLQSLVKSDEAVLQIYVDDLLIAMRGRPEERRKVLSMLLYTMNALQGVMVSLEKGERGTRVQWIGTQFEVFETRKPENGRRITVGLPFKMCKEVYDTLVEWTGKGI